MILKLVIASQNAHKIEELQAVLRPLEIEVLSTKDFPELMEVEEDQDSLEGNALKKANYVAQKTKLPALSDDTGLEVEALDGAPGVFSARYAGENASYEDNVVKLLQDLEGKTNRKAQFRTVLALVYEDQERTFEGICRGEIISQPQGKKGFGYDPVFRADGFEQTFAELEAHQKNEISHRGRALQKFIEFLG